MEVKAEGRMLENQWVSCYYLTIGFHVDAPCTIHAGAAVYKVSIKGSKCVLTQEAAVTDNKSHTISVEAQLI